MSEMLLYALGCYMMAGWIDDWRPRHAEPVSTAFVVFTIVAWPLAVSVMISGRIVDSFEPTRKTLGCPNSRCESEPSHD